MSASLPSFPPILPGGLPTPCGWKAKPHAALKGEITADVAIVGGGYTGLWTALALKARKPSLSIALIEAGLCGCGASGKNGGKAHGYWASLCRHGAESIGDDAALAVARAGAVAQDGHPCLRHRPWPRCLVAGGGEYPRLRRAGARRQDRELMSIPPSAWACPTRRAN